MTPDRARELLGGLSTGILTPQEREMLFEAALHDQNLFNEVADELEFAAFLQSAETRAQLVNRIEVEPRTTRNWTAVLRPRWLAFSGVLAAATVMFVAVWHRSPEPLADARPAAPAIAAAPVPQSKSGPAQQPAGGSVVALPKTLDMSSRVAPAGPLAAAKPSLRKTAGDRSADLRDAVAPAAARPAELRGLEELATRRDLASNSAAAARAPQPMSTQGFRAAEPVLPRSAVPAPPTRLQAKKADLQNTLRAESVPAPAAPRAFTPLAAGDQPGKPAAALEGTVRDPAGAVLGDVAIQVVNQSTNNSVRTRSDAAGNFNVPALPPGGPYTVTAEAPGFSKEERTGITLAENKPQHIDIPLRLGSTSESVQVAAGAALVATDKAKQSGAVSGYPATQQIAVLDFGGGTQQGQSGQQAADLLRTQLLDSGQVRVIDRERVQQAWQSQSRSQRQGQNGSAAIDQPPSTREAAALGRTLGADTVIVGRVRPGGGVVGGVAKDENKADVALSAQVIDTRQARQLAQVSASGASLQSAAVSLGTAIKPHLQQTVEGTVTRVDSSSISVQLKAPGQARIGTRLSVYRGQRKLGDMKLTSVYGQAATGAFAGATPPRVGDRVASSR